MNEENNIQGSQLDGFSEEELEELLQVYFEDSDEQIEILSDELMILEKGGYNKTNIDNIYRIFHSMKSSSMSFGFGEIGDVFHKLEDVLDEVRNGKRDFNAAVLDLSFFAVEKFKIIFLKLREKENYSVEKKEIEKKVEDFLSGETEIIPEREYPSEGVIAENLESTSNLYEKSIRIRLDRINKLIDLSGEMAVRKNYGEVNIPKILKIIDITKSENENIGHILKDIENISPEGRYKEKILKLSLEYKDFFNTQVNLLELLLEHFSRWFFQLNILVEEMKYEVLKTGMVPFASIFSRLRRSFRENSKARGKRINFRIKGEIIEFDRKVMEEIKDPIIHALRNAIDHGIESPEERKMAGKPEEGTVTLTASQMGNEIILEIMDDGKGIDLDKVKRIIVEKGYIEPDKVKYLSDRECYDFLFLPGFSMKDEMSEISGRGVGLNVVSSNIKRLNGQIKIESKFDEGSKLEIRIPSNLSITNVLIFECGEFVFSLQTLAIKRIKKVPVNGNYNKDQRKKIYFEGEKIPLVYFGDYLHLKREELNGELFLIIIENSEKRIALEVDRFLDHQEVVSRPINFSIKEAKYFNAVSSLPDGSVSFILNSSELINDVSFIEERYSSDSEIVLGEDEMVPIEKSGKRKKMFIVGAGKEKFAIYEENVEKAFRFPNKGKAGSKKRRKLIYKDDILWLIHLCDIVGIEKKEEKGEISVLILNDNGKKTALQVDTFYDYQFCTLDEETEIGLESKYIKSEGYSDGGFKVFVLDSKKIIGLWKKIKVKYNITSPIKKESPDLIKESQMGKNTLNVLKFLVGDKLYGLDFGTVLEVVSSMDLMKFNPEDKTPRGFINLRGECVEVEDLRILFENGNIERLPSIIVYTINGIKKGIAVDSILDVIEEEYDELEKTTVFSDTERMSDIYKL